MAKSQGLSPTTQEELSSASNHVSEQESGSSPVKPSYNCCLVRDPKQTGLRCLTHKNWEIMHVRYFFGVICYSAQGYNHGVSGRTKVSSRFQFLEWGRIRFHMCSQGWQQNSKAWLLASCWQEAAPVCGLAHEMAVVFHQWVKEGKKGRSPGLFIA